MAYAYQPPTAPFHQNTNVFGFLEMPDAPYTDSSSGSGYLRETEDLDLSDDEVEEETMTPAEREFIYCLFHTPPTQAAPPEAVPRYMPPPPAFPPYGGYQQPNHRTTTGNPYPGYEYSLHPYYSTHHAQPAWYDFNPYHFSRAVTYPNLTTPRSLPFSPPEPGRLPRRWTSPSHIPARLLYRSLTGEGRTTDRSLTAVVSPLLLLQHWAVEIGERGCGYRIELEYVGTVKLSVKAPEESAKDRANYQHAPRGFRSMTQGFTGLGIEKIEEIARDVLAAQGEYMLGSADCRRFAISLLNRICDEKNAGLKNLDNWETFFGGVTKPIGAVATKALKKMGLLGGGGFL